MDYLNCPLSVVNLAGRIADELQERNFLDIIGVILQAGESRAEHFLDEAQRLDAEEPQLTLRGTRRRTKGGIFFHLARKAGFWPYSCQNRPLMTLNSPSGRVKKMKIKLSGRPKRIKQEDGYTVLIFEQRPLSAAVLPANLPSAPNTTTEIWVYVSLRNWSGALRDLAMNELAQLVVTGPAQINPQPPSLMVWCDSLEVTQHAQE